MNANVQQFADQQQAEYAAYLRQFDAEVALSVTPMTFEEWMFYQFKLTREALRGLFNKLSEYDMLIEMEDAAKQIDHENREWNGSIWGSSEHAEVLGILEAARVMQDTPTISHQESLL